MAKDEFRAEWDAFDEKLSELVNKAMSVKGIGVNRLSEGVGFSQSALSTLLQTNTKGSRSKHWTIPTLLQLAKFFGTSMHQLIYEAENPTPTPMFLIVGGSEPNSLERLQLLIYAAVGYSEQAPAGGYDNVVKMFYNVNAVEHNAPDFCSAYQKGKLSDRQAFALLQDASELLFSEHNKGKISYGTAVNKVFAKTVES